MASTTKIMTAILALEQGDLSSVVTISPKAASTGGSSFWLKSGEKFSLENMLYGLLLPSGNDAAVAIAEHISHDEASFVEAMNQKALELGAMNTHYSNPHGLDEPGHYTTAKDLSIIARYAWGIPKFREIVGTAGKTIVGGDFTRQLYNTNRLLTGFDGANGIKTGYTGKAGRCLVASAVRNDLHLMSVVLGADDHFSSSNDLLSYGFAQYRLIDVTEKVGLSRSIPVKQGIEERLNLSCKPVIMPVKEGEEVDIRYILPKSIAAPVVEGAPVGEMEVYIGGVRSHKEVLKASKDIRKKNYLDYFSEIITRWLIPAI